MDRKALFPASIVILAVLLSSGCRSPYRADRGALFGGLLGAGAGAIIGDSMGNAGAGAAIGAGVGALSGAVIGSELDQIEAENRAAIAQQWGREVDAGAVTLVNVVEMTRAGVSDELIVNHVNIHGVASTLQSSDLIYLKQEGVSDPVIRAMQTPPKRQTQPVVVRQPAPRPVIVQEHHYCDPFWGPRYSHRGHRRYYRDPHCEPGLSLTFHN